MAEYQSPLNRLMDNLTGVASNIYQTESQAKSRREDITERKKESALERLLRKDLQAEQIRSRETGEMEARKLTKEEMNLAAAHRAKMEEYAEAAKIREIAYNEARLRIEEKRADLENQLNKQKIDKNELEMIMREFTAQAMKDVDKKTDTFIKEMKKTPVFKTKQKGFGKQLIGNIGEAFLGLPFDPQEYSPDISPVNKFANQEAELTRNIINKLGEQMDLSRIPEAKAILESIYRGSKGDILRARKTQLSETGVPPRWFHPLSNQMLGMPGKYYPGDTRLSFIENLFGRGGKKAPEYMNDFLNILEQNNMQDLLLSRGYPFEVEQKPLPIIGQ